MKWIIHIYYLYKRIKGSYNLLRFDLILRKLYFALNNLGSFWQRILIKLLHVAILIFPFIKVYHSTWL